MLIIFSISTFATVSADLLGIGVRTANRVTSDGPSSTAHICSIRLCVTWRVSGTPPNQPIRAQRVAEPVRGLLEISDGGGVFSGVGMLGTRGTNCARRGTSMVTSVFV